MFFDGCRLPPKVNKASASKHLLSRDSMQRTEHGNRERLFLHYAPDSCCRVNSIQLKQMIYQNSKRK